MTGPWPTRSKAKRLGAGHSRNMNTDLAAQKAIDRLAEVGFEKLTDSEKVLAAVWKYQAGVANNGFLRYFSSPAADTAFFVPTAFTAIGAAGMAEIAAMANRIFGPDGPPADCAERRACVKGFGDDARQKLTALEERFFNSPEDPDELLEAYLSKTP